MFSTQSNHLLIFPLPPSLKFNVQCITESSILACVFTRQISLITYSLSSYITVIKPSGLLNNSLANVCVVAIQFVIYSPLSFQFFQILLYFIPVKTTFAFTISVPVIYVTKANLILCICIKVAYFIIYV